MANPREIWTVPIGERSTSQWTGTLVDEDGVTPIALASLTTVTLSVLRLSDLSVINSVSKTDIKNTGRGTLHATSGLLTIKFDRADNQLVDTTATHEKHLWVIEYTYNAGADGGALEIEVAIKGMATIP